MQNILKIVLVSKLNPRPQLHNCTLLAVVRSCPTCGMAAASGDVALLHHFQISLVSEAEQSHQGTPGRTGTLVSRGPRRDYFRLAALVLDLCWVLVHATDW